MNRRPLILITGGSSGIGQAIGESFEEAGYDVAAVGRGREDVESCQAAHPTWRVEQCDVSCDEDVARLRASFERLDVLVNAAGMLLRQGQEFDVANFARVVDVNLTGMMRVCQSFQPLLAERGGTGSIVNVASMLSFFGSGFVPAYSASKGGVAQLTKSLAIAWATHGIRVNAVAPGWIKTPLTAPLYTDAGRNQAILDRTPLGRWGEPADVARVVRFLASPDAAFVTGAIIPVDGGYLIA
ncbi:MAG: SDR family oxidoreductase [Pirellulales bacterium]